MSGHKRKHKAHTHDAWILGTHPVPEELMHFVTAHPVSRRPPGYVLVHDIDADTWQLMSPAMFARWYQWVTA